MAKLQVSLKPSYEAPSPALSFLLAAQNADGGWGYLVGARSAVEPSSWALVALSFAPDADKWLPMAERGLHWLRKAQLPDGSWPSFLGQTRGCWATSLACGACSVYSRLLPEICQEPLAGGLNWLCLSVPAEALWKSRVQFWLHGRHHQARQYGWSWTPNTSSWVEPTAYALLALQATPAKRLPKQATNRLACGDAFLLERQCPGGGWDTGNPPCPGTVRTAQVEPTAWALLALLHDSNRDEIHQGLQWLASRASEPTGLAAKAVAELCLRAYGRRSEQDFDVPATFESSPLPNVQAASWLALAERGSWRGFAARGGK